MMDIIGELAKSNPAKLELSEAIEVLECEKKLNGELVNRLHCYPGNQGKRSRSEIINMAINTVLDKLYNKPKAKWVIDEYGDYHCEKCKAIIEKDEWGRHNYNYCYHCGARMETDE